MLQGVRRTRCNPALLDFVTWAVSRGCRLFQRVHITPLGLVTTARIPCYDFVAVVPVEATVSVLNLADDATFPLRVSPGNHGEELAFWQDVSRGSFALIAYLAKTLLLGSPRGLQSYLDVLPFDQAMPIGTMADVAQVTSGYKAAIAPVLRQYKFDESDYNLALRHAYCLFRRHAIPFWSSSRNNNNNNRTSDGSSSSSSSASHTHGGDDDAVAAVVAGAGHPYFAASAFAREGGGDIIGMTPILDLALHSPTPNATIGFPDAEMLQWMAQEKRMGRRECRGYFVMQALRDLDAGEVVTVDKNAYFHFDDDTFKAWFGYTNVAQVPHAATTAATTAATDAQPGSLA